MMWGLDGAGMGTDTGFLSAHTPQIHLSIPLKPLFPIRPIVLPRVSRQNVDLKLAI